MEYVIICLVAFAGSWLTLFSGFGLGTILLPVFGLFFPVEVAIALTAIVHFLNNIFKLLLLGRHADKGALLRFGLPSIVAALLGAWLLTRLTGMEPLYSYTLGDKELSVTPVKLVIAVVLALFALFDIIPRFSKMEFSAKWLPLGGVLSGFFGGLSGMQGALRSAFLVRAGLSKEAFIATGVAIACMIDVTRLSVYSRNIISAHSSLNYGLVLAATLAAFAGAFLGAKLLKKVTIEAVHIVVAVMLLVYSVLLGMGVL
ncbi:sulfite exporter TauE/SafE family protein [Polluticoccus soli]|uniref:sulfite exporter TauE/SafE family protein n=1 Tax=Polluticoccus soli TaxID=3034150 RepID=UPI0023E2DB4F|nr:sulfite exporter TauE/SafE family protein [Flavipsychrobacter sp. JY13-12]